MKLVDMKLSPEEAKEQTEGPAPAEDDGDRYPWGLELGLDDGVLEKLGVAKLPEIGAEVTIQATAKVTGVNQSASESAESRSVRVQIVAMGLEEKPPVRSPGQRMYGD